MKYFFTIFLLFHIVLTNAQTVTNGNFSSATTGWGCGVEVGPESTYGGSTSNNVAEVDAGAGLCQTINGFGVGNIYRLTIDYSRRTGGCPGPNPADANITLNSSLNVNISSSASSYALQTSVFTFTAMQTSLTLNITANFGGTTCGLMIDNIGISLFSVFPVELVNFNATALQNDVLLEWATQSQINNDFFTVERSSDAIHWVPVMEVDGEGTYMQPKSYNQLDRTPLDGVSYYRLKQTDYSKKTSYSSIVSVERASGNFSIYPNPAKDELNLIKEDDRVLTIRIIDALGKESDVEYEEEETLLRIHTSRLANGVYTLKVINSETYSYKRIVVDHN